ncbi:MAG: SH3 domain-containing protein [Chloroflexota bacterium]
MLRFRKMALLVLVMGLIAILFTSTQPASANVVALSLTRRSCGVVTAFATYDGFSEGTLTFYVAFAVDINNNGKFGEAGEPIRFVKIVPGGAAEYVGARLVFNPVPEGSTIAVTAYELDSAGVPVSKQLEPVKYQCTHRPAIDTLPQNTGQPEPPVSVVAKVNIDSVIVYSAPSARSTAIGGLGRGALVNAIARNQRGDWIQIEFRGGLGWIMWQKQTLLLGPYTTLPILPNVEIAAATPVPPTATPTPKP